MEGGAIALDAATTQALQKLLDDPATTAAALPIVAKWDKAGVLSAKADGHAQRMLRDLGDAADERRAPCRQRRQPACRSRPPRAGALRDCADAVRPRGAGVAQRPPDRRARRDRRQRCRCRDDRGAGAHQLDAAVRSAPEASGFLARVAGGDEGGESHAGEPRTRQRRAAAHASEPAGGAAGRRAPRRAVAGREGEERHRRGAAAGDREAWRWREGQDAVHGRMLELPQAGRPWKERGRPTAERHGRTRPRRAAGAHRRSQPRSRPQLLAVERHDAQGRDARRRDRERKRREPHAAQRGRRRGDQEGRHRDAREHAPLAHARGARGARRRGAARHPHVPAGEATTRSSASSICVRPTRRTAAAGSAAKRSATRRSRCTSSGTCPWPACRSS